MKTVVDTIDIVMKLGDEFEQKTGRTRGISDYVWDRLPEEHKFAKRYIIVLRHYGRKLKQAGVWQQVVDEQWDAIRIRSFVKKFDQIKR